MKKYIIFFISVFVLSVTSFAQKPEKLSSDEIFKAIQKLNFFGSVLYIAAHPDDENTRLISYFSNDVHARTGYLSLTRGDGGQNLIGPEIRELLGVIRTNELLQARRTDGGIQFFSRANDFGYSKNPEETLEIWDKEAVLKDMVKVIREFRPDIIINRFNSNSAGKTHGHHTSSAILSEEAFSLSGDRNFKVGDTKPWQPKRLFFNTNWWFYGSKANFDKKVDKSRLIRLNSGLYDPLTGLSNTEVASLSRSMHKSQGFGNTGTRGDQTEYLEFLKGDKPIGQDIFSGIDTSWKRVKGGQKIGGVLKKVERDFDFKDPAASIPLLLKAYQLIQKLEDDHWRNIKIQEITDILGYCSGLYLEAVSKVPDAAGGEMIKVGIEVINRSKTNISLNSVVVLPKGDEQKINKDLSSNQQFNIEETLMIPENERYTTPYWLDQKGSLGMYAVEDKTLIGEPLTPQQNKVVFKMTIEGIPVIFERNIVFKYNDPVKGEMYQPFEIIPKVTSAVESGVIIFDSELPKEIPVKIAAHSNNLKGKVRLVLPPGWEVSPREIPISLHNKGQVKRVSFTVTPPVSQDEGFLKVQIEMNGKLFDRKLYKIRYDHIPEQSVILPSESKIVRLNIAKRGENIGYIKGAGDDVPASLRQIGYKVTMIDPKDITENSLEKYDAVIVGIRAYNIDESLINSQKFILDYVKNGGNLIVQYNTSQRLKVKENLAPFTMRLSHDRVTDENAEVRFLKKHHEILNYPNKITSKDFEGWVQERGLYFPDQWADEFTPVLSIHDKGESPKEGSLLVARYGKGYYIYTGLSFFRELPAGVPGAYKLFANMISIGKNNTKKLKD